MMKITIHKTILLGLACAAALAAGCGAPGDQARWPRLKLLVAAEAHPYAAGLGDYLQQYHQRMGTLVDVTTAPTAQVAARMAAPDPPDVVILCDPAAVAALEAKGLVTPPRWVLEQTRDRLALVTRADSPATVKNLEELARSQTGTVGLADPTQSASGAAARDLLAARGLASPLAERQREFKDLAALEAAIGAGEVTMGFTRETRLAEDAGKGKGKKFKVLLTLDPLAGKQPPYLALVANGRSARPGAAHQLWGYLEPWARNPGFFLVPKPGSGNVIALPAEQE